MEGVVLENKVLTHFDENNQPQMVDVSNKETTHRVARASGLIRLTTEAFNIIHEGKENKKGDVLAVARIAAIQAAKQTQFLIPLCHQINLSSVNIDFSKNIEDQEIKVIATVKTNAETGVEMEALTAVMTGLLTIYDMLKAINKGFLITDVKLEQKDGGKSGLWEL